ncbi:MAG: universal stress protein, partial [SAR324 cluster bacterium]|nr:universal stress protein [SAR324 cluster bacterium]
NLNEQSFANKALHVAVEQARLHQAELHIITVIPGFNMPMVASFFPEDSIEKAIGAVKLKLKEYTAAHIPEEMKATLHIAVGEPYKEILKCRKNIQADLIVLQSHHDGIEHILLGSVASKVVEHAKVSVMVIRS